MKKIEFNNLQDFLAFNIKYYRYINNLSQEQLAELSHLSPEYISRIERGLNSPTVEKLDAIAKALKTETYLLLKYNNDIDENILTKLNSTRQYNQYNTKEWLHDKNKI